MNDPHVDALHYRIAHNENVSYQRAAPLEHRTDLFTIRIESGTAQVWLVEHYATADEARAVVDPFLRTWEMHVALQFSPGELRFVFERADIVDRKPTPGGISAEPARYTITGFAPTVTIGRSKYPDPPINLDRGADVDLMFERYVRYRNGGTTLPDAANYCLTVLKAVGGRRGAAQRFAISEPVLHKLSGLAANKGGPEARKYHGSTEDFSPAEREWLDKALRAIIRRAAEVAFDPCAPRPQITMADLPEL